MNTVRTFNLPKYRLYLQVTAVIIIMKRKRKYYVFSRTTWSKKEWQEMPYICIFLWYLFYTIIEFAFIEHVARFSPLSLSFTFTFFSPLSLSFPFSFPVPLFCWIHLWKIEISNNQNVMRFTYWHVHKSLDREVLSRFVQCVLHYIFEWKLYALACVKVNNIHSHWETNDTFDLHLRWICQYNII